MTDGQTQVMIHDNKDCTPSIQVAKLASIPKYNGVDLKREPRSLFSVQIEEITIAEKTYKETAEAAAQTDVLPELIKKDAGDLSFSVMGSVRGSIAVRGSVRGSVMGSVIGNRFRPAGSIANPQGIHFRDPNEGPPKLALKNARSDTLQVPEAAEEPDLMFDDPFAKLAEKKQF